MIVFANLNTKNPNQPHLEEARARIERTADDECRMVNAWDLSMARVEELRPVAICYSGTTSADAAELPGLKSVMTEWPGPQIAFCGGAQIAALLFGCEVDRMRELHSDEKDPADWYAPGYFKEFGLVEVEVVDERSPLFNGLPSILEVYQLHASMITASGDASIRILARNDTCPVQAYVHVDRPFWGVQFHPEYQPVFHPHGHFLLQNFFKHARSL